MTDTEFEKALHKGLGRCVVELASLENIEAHKNTVLDCCTKNISSYIPFEKSRGEFLYKLVKKYNDNELFLQPVISKYTEEEPDSESSYKLLVQMTDFLWAFSNEDNSFAYAVLMDKYLMIKEVLCKVKDKTFFKDFFEYMSLKFIESEGFGGFIRAVLAIDKICKVNEIFEFADFCTILDIGEKEFRRKKILQEVFLYAGRKMYNYFYISFKTQQQTTTELQAEKDLATPLDISKICSEAMRIMQKGEKAKETEIFEICKKIIALHQEKQKKRVPKELILFVYENSPSSELRWQAMRIMGKKRMITPEIAEEAIYDCNENIVRYIKQYHTHLLL